ncbi:ATP-dependent helicase dcl2 [Eremomyces bilateralis CBS 781.70]|uniref:ATP-dependent helicase dcl2 n=1 Tax=Eremomyces bilateralis CBS 781.70 TaxID=1392243 RepID=A0A6G1G4E8_9PEZI|nr:ATP-dependent helicase dcl2 [Eremomyces bilateralis CBS 781.70]KAF1812933.1 ATP-dependent helicase dcl2 [Eremomyces bilateralis CBS 781.70]
MTVMALGDVSTAGQGQIRTRSYQMEMFERSMKGNVIVAMDTGSGKTHIALLRIMAELERCGPDKLLWFLAPGVALCNQQFKTISSQLPSVRMRVLVGSDNVDRWSEQRIWDAALQGVRVVFSTHAVLADALSHGFIKMAQLALLVFDEAHHCTKQHPANKIMRDFYHPAKASKASNSVPHILGLSASPVAKSNINDLGTIEANLDAVSVTPRINRQELLKHVHQPKAIKLEYEHALRKLCALQSPAYCALMKLCDVFSPLDELGKQLETFSRKATHIYDELGPWGAEYFILESVAVLKKGGEMDSFGYAFSSGGQDLRAHLLAKLAPIVHSSKPEDATKMDDLPISPKVELLISFLAKQDPEVCAGLIFVEQRAVVYVLSRLLSIHPQTRSRFRCATFVGESSWGKRKLKLNELVDIKAQKETLLEFRTGVKNLVVATKAMEEGIDISACNLVVGFDPPKTLKSFIQCRGRARHEESSYIIMLAKGDSRAKADKWEALEEELIRIYQNEARMQQELAAIEEIDEKIDYKLKAPSTGAMLTANSMIAHVHHFCNLLPKEPYVDYKPEFTFHEDTSHLITATLTLPNGVNAAVRTTVGKKAWRTERAAMKDAAFHAYEKLYKADLLNENLLPLPHGWHLTQHDQEEQDRPAVLDVSPQLDPWIDLAEAWQSPDFHEARISILDQTSNQELRMVLITPSAIPEIPRFDLYWNPQSTLTAGIASKGRIGRLEKDPRQLLSFREATNACHAAARRSDVSHEYSDYIALFAPDMTQTQLSTWLPLCRGSRNAIDVYRTGAGNPDGIVTVAAKGYARYIPIRWIVSSASASESGPSEESIEIDCRRLPKRQNFLLPEHNWKSQAINPGLQERKIRMFSAHECTMDTIPFVYAQFGLFIPAILQHIEVYSVAERVRTTVLKSIPFQGLEHIVAAITAPSKRWTSNYQRLEFIGDTVLKYTVSIQLYTDHPTWPEGYLSSKRDSLVSNSRLLKAAKAKGLERFIMTEQFKGGKFSPLRVSEALDPMKAKEGRTVSTKVIADVVEALIGAAYVEFQHDEARKCINLFLPEIRAKAPILKRPGVPVSPGSHSHLNEIEALIGYSFLDRSILLEAVTHPAGSTDAHTESYQRLEYLGDAVLDMVVVSILETHEPDLSESEMTLCKHALVNGDFLGFLCLETTLERDKIDIIEHTRGNFMENRSTDRIQLCMYMRHRSKQVWEAQAACSDRHLHLRKEIKRALESGSSFPWVLLERLRPDKFFSDIIESIIGAIFVDSSGDLGLVRQFVEKIGLMNYTNRLMKEKVDVLHPKTALHLMRPNATIDLEVKPDEGETLFCEVSVGGARVCTVRNCLNKDEAKAAGAEQACKILASESMEGIQMANDDDAIAGAE